MFLETKNIQSVISMSSFLDKPAEKVRLAFNSRRLDEVRELIENNEFSEKELSVFIQRSSAYNDIEFMKFILSCPQVELGERVVLETLKGTLFTRTPDMLEFLLSKLPLPENIHFTLLMECCGYAQVPLLE